MYYPDVVEARFTKVFYIYGQNVNLLSRITPSILTVSDTGTAVPARSILVSGKKERSRTRDQNKIVSDLSAFIAKPLKNVYIDERNHRVLVYQTDQCVTEQCGAEYHLHTVVIGLQTD